MPDSTSTLDLASASNSESTSTPNYFDGIPLPPNVKTTRTPWALDPKVQVMEVTHLNKPTDTYFERRVETLHEMLLDNSLSHQHENYKAALAMYKTGATPDNSVDGWNFVDGKFYEDPPVLEQLPSGSIFFLEKRAFQFPHESYSSPAFQFPHSTAYNRMQGRSSHEIPMFLRLVPHLGGDPTRFLKVRVLNDTGSARQTLCPRDLTRLGYNRRTYRGIQGLLTMDTANGVVDRLEILMEIQVLKDDEVTPLTGWIQELGVAMPWPLGFGFSQHLSGERIRRHLYFATAPGNQQLYVARSKSGVVNQLPVV